MNKKHALPFIIILLAAGGLMFAMIKNALPEHNDGSVDITNKGVTVATIDAKASDPVLGNRKADVTVFLFSDFGCDHCAGAVGITKQLTSLDDNVRVVWKDLPATQFPTPSEPAHIAARCAQQQGSFWEYHDLLFENQLNLSDVTYYQIADELELNEEKFRACLTTQQTKPLIDANIILSQEVSVDATPFFVIGTERFSGVRTLSYMQQVVQRNQP